MAGEDKILRILLQIQSDLKGLTDITGGLKDLKGGLEDTAKAGFSLGDAFKFAGAEEALRRTIDVLKEVGDAMVHVVEASVEKAAEIQTEEFPLTQMLRGSGAVAKEVLEGINSLWQQFGVISNESLARAAQALILMQVPAENLIPRLTELSKISVATGVDLEDVASAYQRLRQAIINETEPMIRGMGGFGMATQAMVDTLMDYLGKSQGALMTMFRTGQIDINDLRAALRAATDEGGRFANVIEDKKNTFQGAVKAMQTAWQGFEVELGKPIIDALTPVVKQVGNIERALAKIAEDHGWQVAIEAAWELLIDKMAEFSAKTLIDTFSQLGGHLFDELWMGWLQNMITQHPKIAHLIFGDIDTDALNAGIRALDSFLKGFTGSQGAAVVKAAEALKAALKSVAIQSPLGPEVEEHEEHAAKGAKDLAAAMHDLSAAMQAIHQQQQLIQQNPFLTVDEKQRALLQSYTSELQSLQAQIAKLESLKAGPLDKAQLSEVNQKLQEANFQVDLLRIKMTGLAQPFRAELATWVNNWGVALRQVADLIKGTIEAALQSVNTLLLDAAFRTGDWRQALQGVERQIISLFLTFIEHLALQKAAQLLGITSTTSAVVGSNVAIAASAAPAAAGTSIASYGSSAAIGEATALAAIAAIEGALGAAAAGTLHEGGPVRRKRMHEGGLAPDEVPIIAQEGEIMIQRSVAQQPGMMDFLLALNAGASFHRGGAVRRFHGGGGDFDGDYPPGDLWGPMVPPGRSRHRFRETGIPMRTTRGPGRATRSATAGPRLHAAADHLVITTRISRTGKAGSSALIRLVGRPQ